MKKITIITFFESVAKIYSKNLKTLFGELVDINFYSYDKQQINKLIDTDVVVVSLESIYVSVKKYIPSHAKIIIISRTITKDQYKKIAQIKNNKKVLLVNYSAEMTFEAIALLDRIGINNLEFIPVYPGVLNIPKIDLALTPGETQCVPSFVKKTIDIGHRVLDVNTITNIAIKLNMEYMLKQERVLNYFESLMVPSEEITKLIGKANTLESELNTVLNVMDEGIILVDQFGIIRACTKKAKKIIDYKGKIEGCYLSEKISKIPFEQTINDGKILENKLIKISGRDISVGAMPIFTGGKITGALIIMNVFEEKEKKQHKLRAQLLGHGHIAKYKFEDIIGQSKEFVEIKNVAKKMAKSQSSVLITGESGTGKELFAQAIHNNSKRKEYQFVAVNCAALPESLLESELFGYEEGAFTGARKGGKLGLFELAHKGTLFLDEVGEMDLCLQSRLLRVIQEREVMRLGGDSVIKIDTRIIAATNKNLKELVKKGKFRKDLYYRLNVLPLEIIPLRERKEDILILFEYMKSKINAKFELSKEVKELFKNYYWDGNLRELKNYVEYLAYLDKDYIEFVDLPKMLRENNDGLKIENEEDKELKKELKERLESVDRLKDEIGSKIYEYKFVLDCLEESFKKRKRIGRRSIVKLANEKGLFLTEAEVRNILSTLEKYNLLILSNGRGGTKLTTLGLKIIQNINWDNDIR